MLFKQIGILLPKSHINLDAGTSAADIKCVPILIEAV